MFVKNPKNPREHLWVPKTAAQVKAESTDKAAAQLARRTPTSGKQTILSQHNREHPEDAVLKTP